MKQEKPTDTKELVKQALIAAGKDGLISREIADAVGGITPGTAGNYARRLEAEGFLTSELESHPGYGHIIRRRYRVS